MHEAFDSGERDEKRVFTAQKKPTGETHATNARSKIRQQKEKLITPDEKKPCG